MGKSSWVSIYSPNEQLVSQSLTQWNVEKGLYRLVKGILQDYLQLPATWVAKTVLPPEKEHVSKKGTIPNGHFIFQQSSIFRGYTFVFRGVSLCMTLTGRLRYFLGAETKKEHTFSWPLPESYMVHGRFYPILPWKKIRHTQWTWVKLGLPNPIGSKIRKVFWKPLWWEWIVFSQGKKLKMMEPKLAFSGRQPINL